LQKLGSQAAKRLRFTVTASGEKKAVLVETGMGDAERNV